MNRLASVLVLVLILTAGAALAGLPVATPVDGQPAGDHPAPPPGALKALGDPTDFAASFVAGAEYLRAMQADVTEDNAGNGDPDDDPEDGGWDWESTVFEHSAGASPMNIYGATGRGLLEAYLLDPRAEWFTALKDAADQMVAIGPDPGVRSAADVVYLLKFADLPACPDPAFYQAGAQTIWTRHIGVYGSMVGLAEYIRDARAGSYPNGIIPWDISAWVEAAVLMDAVFPAGGHAAEAAAMAEVIYEDSLGTPTYFDVFGRCQGYTLDYSNRDYWWYALGVHGLIRAFETAGVHLGELPALEAALLACQYDDGSFSFQYGAPADMNDRDWQSTAYAAYSLYENMAPTPTTMDALHRAASFLAGSQDVASGGWVYDDGVHNLEVGGEATAAVAMGWAAAGVLVGADAAADLINCGETNVVTFGFTPGPATPALRGYDVTLAVTGPVSFGPGDFADLGSLAAIGTHAFYAVDNGDGTWTVSDALLGGSTGLEAAAGLFSLTLTPTGDGPVAVDVVGYRLRDLDNVDIFADVAGTGFTVDCTAPPAVTDITAAPGHDKIVVDWAMADESDVAVYEVWRGLWYDTTPGNSAYPEYDDLAGDVIPTRPADRADADISDEWVLAGTVPVGTLTFTDTGMAGRGVYYYEVFAVDAAVNHGPVAAGNDRATSYWLGDVMTPYDGYVDSGDITQLGATFGLGEGDTGYNNHVDVGPTDDASGRGIPQTDSVVDFEDLMIFALNYGNVGPAKDLPVAGAAPALAWSRIDETTWALDLAAPCASLKGVRLRAALPEGVTAVVTAGDLLGRQDDRVFFANVGGLDASAAVLGTGRGFVGSGRVLTVSLSSPADLGAARLDARALDNSRFEDTGTPVATRAFAVRPAYPNPFNPTTTLAFDLPRDSFVRVEVFAVDGRRVRSLLGEERAAGPQSVQWDGRDDAGNRLASGTYLYRVRAGAWEATRKMQLVK